MQRNYGVIGFPIGHTMSPFIQKELFKAGNFGGSYEKYEITPEELKNGLSEIKKLDGFNVTIPHKIAIIDKLDTIDDTALEYGAVNTVKNENRFLSGFNTDAFGFLEGLKISGIPFKGKIAVLGYGGAARVVIAEGLKAGLEVYIVTAQDRIEKAQKVAKELGEKQGKEVFVTTEETNEHFSLLVNATPIGMYPKINAMPVKADFLDKTDAVYDIVYNPYETLLLKTAREKGKKCGFGLSMLVLQAAKAQSIWYGAEFSDTDIKNVIEKSTEELNKLFPKRENIVLCGFMGSGKTTIGKALAKRLNMAFVDTDEEIVKRENRSISEIFENKGEEYFRGLEKAVIEELSVRCNTVISLGGGAAARKENFSAIKACGRVVKLDCGIKNTLLRILNDKSRPLAESREAIIKRYNERKPLYEAVADFKVDSIKSRKQTTDKIISLLGEEE